MQTQDNTETCYWRENRSTWQKTCLRAIQAEIDQLVNKLEYMNIKKTLQA